LINLDTKIFTAVTLLHSLNVKTKICAKICAKYWTFNDLRADFKPWWIVPVTVCQLF